jgi:hypothetical protein
MHEKFWIVSELPDYIKLDDRNRPHCETGPYIRWRDGFDLHYWHGVKVPMKWIEDRTSIDPKSAINWPNVEQRRAAANLVGWVRVLDAVKARVIDEDRDPMIGTLLEADLPDSPGERFLKIRCGTGRDFVLPVGREVKTALEANARTFRVKNLTYFQNYVTRT